MIKTKFHITRSLIILVEKLSKVLHDFMFISVQIYSKIPGRRIIIFKSYSRPLSVYIIVQKCVMTLEHSYTHFRHQPIHIYICSSLQKSSAQSAGRIRILQLFFLRPSEYYSKYFKFKFRHSDIL